MKHFINSLYKRKDDYSFIISIDKEKAKFLLSINDTANRELNELKVNDYVEIMNSGNWETRQGSFLGFSYYDEMISDGQHRLNAFIKSNLQTLETFICFG